MGFFVFIKKITSGVLLHLLIKGEKIAQRGTFSRCQPMLFAPWIKQSRIYLRRDNEKAKARVPQMPIEGRW